MQGIKAKGRGEMARLIVIVEKDDSGKLWDYAISEQDQVGNRHNSPSASLLIHLLTASEKRAKTVEQGAGKKALWRQ